MTQDDDTQISFSLNAVTVSRQTRDDHSYVEVAFRPWVADKTDRVGPFDGIRITAHHKIGDEPSARPKVEMVPFMGRVAPGAHNLIQGALRSMGLPEDAFTARSRDGSEVQPQFSQQGIIWRGQGAEAVLALPGPLMSEGGETVFAAAMTPDGNMIGVVDMADLGHSTNGALTFWGGGAAPVPPGPHM